MGYNMFVSRDFTRTEHDDYVLHIQPILDRYSRMESVAVYNEDKVIIGWKIQNRYE